MDSAPCSTKYSARRPSSAKALVAKTRNGSPVMPYTAGTESTAKTMSVANTAMTTSANGVATAHAALASRTAAGPR